MAGAYAMPRAPLFHSRCAIAMTAPAATLAPVAINAKGTDNHVPVAAINLTSPAAMPRIKYIGSKQAKPSAAAETPV
jgi:hypothetical protein